LPSTGWRCLPMAKHKAHDRWFTTTEAAKLCGLSHMTVIRRFDNGDIKGFRVPGSRFRRIPRENLLEFAVRHGIPLAETLGGGASSEDKGPAGAPGRRVLIVEDDRRMAELLEKIMTTDGWEVRVARNGFDAGFFAGSFLPDLILLDILLPGLDGREACKLLRSDPRLAGTKVLAVTALRDERSVSEILAAGADGHMGKPFAINELRDKVAALTGVAIQVGQLVDGGLKASAQKAD
jgi:two-component system, OmpR family, response regulator